jgi:hypothetical protein
MSRPRDKKIKGINKTTRDVPDHQVVIKLSKKGLCLHAPSAKKEGTYLSQTGGEVAKVSCINKILPTFFTDFDRCI